MLRYLTSDGQVLEVQWQTESGQQQIDTCPLKLHILVLYNTGHLIGSVQKQAKPVVTHALIGQITVRSNYIQYF